MSSEDKLASAAALVADAVDGYFIGIHPANRSLWWSSVWHNGYYLRCFVAVSLVFLSFVEKPAWCFGDDLACDKDARYPRSALPTLSAWKSLLTEVILMSWLLLDVVIKALGLGLKRVLRGRATRGRLFFLFLALVDASRTLIFLKSLERSLSFVRVSPLCRSFLLVTTLPPVRETMLAVWLALPEICVVLSLMCFHIFIFAWSGFILFSANPNDPYFASFSSSVSSLQILLTTANFPDVMMAAITENRAAFLFFFAFLILGLYILMPLTLAVVYKGFSRRRDEITAKQERNRSKSLDAAFFLLNRNQTHAGLTLQCVQSLFRELNTNYHRIAFINDRMASILLEALDQDKSRIISRSEFQTLCTILQPKTQKHLSDASMYHEDEPFFRDIRTAREILEDRPMTVFNCRQNTSDTCWLPRAYQRFVESRYFHWLVNLVMALNLVRVALETSLVNQDPVLPRPYRHAEVLTIILKNTLLYSTLLYSTLLYSTLLYSTLLYSTLLCSTLLYSALLYSTLLYSTLIQDMILYEMSYPGSDMM
eukprot:g2121.t1